MVEKALFKPKPKTTNTENAIRVMVTLIRRR